MKGKIGTATLFPNGNIMVTDKNGNQISELSTSIVNLFSKYCVKHGYEPDGLIIDALNLKYKVIKTNEGYNHEVI